MAVTGQFDRVQYGLQLMADGAIDELFISGVNKGAGMTSATFADQFHLSPQLRADEQAGRIVLAPDANTTLENAVETACWLEANSDIDRIALITSDCHMPRASLAMARAVPWRVTVERLDVPHPAGGDARSCSITDFVKFAATWAITLLPDRFWSRDVIQTCLMVNDSNGTG
ncbi:YdcF family protein [Amorphus sp. 3PC139-8]|uniref:YdcF family protein n=1 Tax=Amorphus sp. 3PC139-8 TaxID=2735676 RepID=UPI00345DC3F2